MGSSLSGTDTPWNFGVYNARAHLKTVHYCSLFVWRNKVYVSLT